MPDGSASATSDGQELPPWFDFPQAIEHPTQYENKTNLPVIVIGAGLAGCALAWSLNRAGIDVTLVDAGDAVAARASGNTRAICRPQINRNNSDINLFYETAFKRTRQRVTQLTRSGHKIEHCFDGLLQLLDDKGTWPTLQSAIPVNAQIASDLAGIKLESDALYFPRGGWINAADYCKALIADASQTQFLRQRQVISKTFRQGLWHLSLKHTPSQSITRLRSDRVVLTCGPGINALCPTLLSSLRLLLTPSTGQTTTCKPDHGTLIPRLTITGKKYLIPEPTLCTVGATHQRGVSTVIPQTEDDHDNLRGLHSITPSLAKQFKIASHWRSTRISTADRLPVLGPCPDGQYYQHAYAGLKHGPQHRSWSAPRYLPGLYLLTGLGSRGAVSAALCADLLSAQISGESDREENRILPCSSIGPLIHPARFLIRDCKRGKC